MKEIFLYCPIEIERNIYKPITDLGYSLIDAGSFLSVIDLDNKIICKYSLQNMYNILGSHYETSITHRSNLEDILQLSNTNGYSIEKILYEIPNELPELINTLKSIDFSYYKKKKLEINLIYE